MRYRRNILRVSVFNSISVGHCLAAAIPSTLITCTHPSDIIR